MRESEEIEIPVNSERRSNVIFRCLRMSRMSAPMESCTVEERAFCLAISRDYRFGVPLG